MIIKKKKNWERDRETNNDICYNYDDCKVKESIIVDTTKENPQQKYFSWYCFLMINEFSNYFYIMGRTRTSYKFEWLEFFFFF